MARKGIQDEPGLAAEGPTVGYRVNVDDEEDTSESDPIPQETLVCALTGEFRSDKPEERILQGLVEQLHREYHVDMADMARDVKISSVDGAGKRKTHTVSIVVFEHGKSRVRLF